MSQVPATDPNLLRRRVVRSAGGMLGLRAANVALTLGLGVLLARLLGATGYGAFVYAVSWVTLLLIPAQLGFDKLLLRELPRATVNADGATIRGLIAVGRAIPLAVSLVIAAAAMGVSFLMADSLITRSFRLGMILLPPMVLLTLTRAAVQGLGWVRLAHVPEMLIQPLGLAVLVGIGWWQLGEDFSPFWALGAAALAVAGAWIGGEIARWRIMTAPARAADQSWAPGEWLKLALPLMLLGSMLLINKQADLVMLGLLAHADDVGVYAVAARGAELIMFVLIAVKAVIAPDIARYHAQGQHLRLQRTLRLGTGLALIFGLPLAVVLIAAGHWVLWLFGEEFIRGRTALTILAAGQFLTLASGPVRITLMMTGHERDALVAVLIGLLANITLNLLLIPPFGIEGAALATTSCTIAWTSVLAYRVWRRLGVDPTALSILLRRTP